MAPKIRLMAEYGCLVLWWDGGDQVGPIEPEELGLSESLTARLLAWGEVYDNILDEEDPIKSAFDTPEDEAAFVAEGWVLLGLLREELGDTYSVRYQV